MAKPTTHGTLERMGFSPVGQRVTPGGSRTGDITTTHYATTRQSVGDGNVVRPITHHVIVDEYGAKPGKYNVHYRVTQNNEPYSGGEFDKLYRHQAHTSGGVSDPIASIMGHHSMVSKILDHRSAPPLSKVTPDNIHSLVTDMDSWTPWDGNGRSIRTRTTQPNYGGLYGLSSAPEEPLDVEVHRRLTGGSAGPKFSYHGRFPGTDDTDVYHATHSDPENPRTFQYDFTVRHNPSMKDPFSYNAKRRQSGVDDDLTQDKGSFLDVTGDSSPVAKLGTVNQLIRRHNDVLRAIGIMSSKQKSSAVLQHCPDCGGTDVDWIEDYGKDENGLHSIPTGQYTGQCNNCYSEFKPGEDHVSFPDDNDPLLKQYRSDSYHREASILDDADGDLRP